jgi:hypothetical protein
LTQKGFYTNPFLALANIQEDDHDKHDDCFRSTQILQSKYDRADVNTVASQQTHLSLTQQEELQIFLYQWNKLFQENLVIINTRRWTWSYCLEQSPSMPNHIPFHVHSMMFFKKSWNI